MPSQRTSFRPTRADIDLGALGHNFRVMREMIGADVRIMAVVKADAYGHGSLECAARLENEGVDWFGVAIPEEGVALRKAGITRQVLCMGSIWPGQEQLITDHHLTPVVFAERTASLLNDHARSIGRSLDVHIKIDTGMGRVGIRYDEVDPFLELLNSFSAIRVAGLMTHFASAESASENEFTALQVARFNDVIERFRAAGHSPEWLDLANSPGAIVHPESRGNMVRLGGGLYGILDDILPEASVHPGLKPVMSLRSKIANIKTVPAGETLGYGRTFETKTESRIALVPVGYADGYPRGLGNRGRACIRGQKAPVVGRISMDWTLFDVTNIDGVSIDDEVTLIGCDGETRITAADLASELDTIGYEITCGIGPRVRRIFI
jgi:alanine racemase